MSELLVLGNGFDIACGLKSTYTDFYNYRYFDDDKKEGNILFNEINRILALDIEEILEIKLLNQKENNVSFWDFIFCQEKLYGENWTDVEEVLAEKINQFRNLDLVFNRDDYAHGPSGSQIDISALEISDFNPTTTINGIKAEFRKLAKIFLIFVKVRYSQIKVTSSRDSISNILLKELIIFEENFQKYLSNEVEHNVNYAENFRKLFVELVYTDVGRYERRVDSEIYVLSFNYTTFSDVEVNSNPDLIYNNVHGQLSMKNNIFGIDITRNAPRNYKKSIFWETERFEDKFLKTYRTLSLPNKEKFYNNEVNVIRFYGHSLAQADYVYFKVIFDSLDLFNKDVQLIFFYSDYTDIMGNKVNEKQNQINRVRKLLLKYEASLNSEIPYQGYIFDKLRTQGRLTFMDVTEKVMSFK